MLLDLMPWLILWAFVTTGVLVLLIWRVLVAKQEPGGLHIIEGEEKEMKLQTKLAVTLARIDLWGKTLTVASAILIVVIGSAWLYNGWLKANEVIR